MSLAVKIYRIGNFFHRNHMKVVGMAFSALNRILLSTWIPSSAEIGKNFSVGYWGLGVVIHTSAKIGNNCLVAQNVTIGRNFGDKKVPQIGDDVYIGTGSVIFGEIIIGNNVIIGSNSVVNKSIPDNCTVVGNPMKVVAKDRV